MRLIDADELMEHVYRDKLDSRELIADMVNNAPTIAQPETAKRIVGKSDNGMTFWYQCGMCNEPVDAQDNYCRGCGRRLIDE